MILLNGGQGAPLVPIGLVDAVNQDKIDIIATNIKTEPI